MMTKSEKQIVNYYQLPELEDIYLEDSYVLGIVIEMEKVEINLEVVLTENHPLYESPNSNEQYCYRKAKLSFSNIGELIFRKIITTSYKDASGEVDYGNIDSFILHGSLYKLNGDWGEMEVSSSLLSLKIEK